MQIVINGQLIETDHGATLLTVLADQLAGKVQGIAVALNDMVIRRTEWPDRQLNQGDRILIIRATQGG